MFGLSFEKLLVVMVIAGFVIGPQRLPVYAQQLAQQIRSLRRLLETARTEAESELGVPLARTEWQAMDPRQYDPRRIIREALTEPVATPAPPVVDQRLLDEARRVRPGQRYLVSGSAAHPRRVLIASLPEDDPRRVAAELPAEEPDVEPVEVAQ